MQLEDQANWLASMECEESYNFLVGLGNGIWMSLVLGTVTYWLAQIFANAGR